MIYWYLGLQTYICLILSLSHRTGWKDLCPQSLRKWLRVGKACLAHSDLTHPKDSTVPFFAWSQTMVAGEEESSGGRWEDGSFMKMVFFPRCLWNIWMRLAY